MQRPAAAGMLTIAAPPSHGIAYGRTMDQGRLYSFCEPDPAGFEDLSARRAFDLIAAVNGPYGYVLDMAVRRNVLQRCAAALRPRTGPRRP